MYQMAAQLRFMEQSEKTSARSYQPWQLRFITMRIPTILMLLILATMAASHAEADSDRDFTVDFVNCSEFAGEGPVSLTEATPLVPTGYSIATVNGMANIVVRATSCDKAKVNGDSGHATVLSQIGINIIAPDGTGDINNYTLVYVSNNLALVAAFCEAGLPAQYDPQLSYEYSGSTTTNGNLYVTAGTPGLSPYTIYGPETAPPANSATVFLANWWFAPRTRSGLAQMRQQTLFPQISFGTSGVTLYTSAHGLIGKLIGGNTFSNYSVLALRGVYPAAHMDVTVAR